MEMDAVLASEEWIKWGGYTLITLGVTLLIIEFFVPSFGLFGFAGVASAVIGVVQLHQTGKIDYLPISTETLTVIAFIGAGLSVAGGLYSFKLLSKKVTTGTEAMIGKSASVLEWEETEGRVHIMGEDWQAFSDEPMEIQKEQIVKIIDVQNLKLKIERI
jgi:membrane-bound serine protease (ClpP class)